MKHLFVPYKIALQLKEKGFDEQCYPYWYYCNLSKEWDITFPQTYFKKWYTKKEILAPTHQQVIDWFRESYNISIEMSLCWLDTSTGPWKSWGYSFMDIKTCKRINGESINTAYEDYYITLNKAIEEALKLI